MALATMTTAYNDTVLHVRFDGRSDELDLGALGLDRQATDEAVKRAVAAHYGRPAYAFDGYVLTRYDNALVLRPEAIYG